MRLANNWVTCVPSLVFGVGGCSVDSKQPIRSPLVRGERRESYNWGGKRPVTGEERVLPLGRREKEKRGSATLGVKGDMLPRMRGM